jgi:ketosteroid isomerase-like protein
MSDNAVEAANERFYQAFNDRDIEVMRGLWHRGGDGPVVCVHPGWEPLTGFEPILKSWADIFRNAEDMNIRVSHVEARTSGELGWVSCRETLFVIHPNGVHTSRVHASNLFRQVDGEWKMVLHHASSVPPQGEASPEN